MAKKSKNPDITLLSLFQEIPDKVIKAKRDDKDGKEAARRQAKREELAKAKKKAKEEELNSKLERAGFKQLELFDVSKKENVDESVEQVSTFEEFGKPTQEDPQFAAKMGLQLKGLTIRINEIAKGLENLKETFQTVDFVRMRRWNVDADEVVAISKKYLGGALYYITESFPQMETVNSSSECDTIYNDFITKGAEIERGMFEKLEGLEKKYREIGERLDQTQSDEDFHQFETYMHVDIVVSRTVTNIQKLWDKIGQYIRYKKELLEYLGL